MSQVGDIYLYTLDLERNPDGKSIFIIKCILVICLISVFMVDFFSIHTNLINIQSDVCGLNLCTSDKNLVAKSGKKRI